jgi:polyisoprenoid-binding protein YceI
MNRCSILRKTLLIASLLLAVTAAAASGKLLSPVWELSQVLIEFKVYVMGVLAVTGQFHDVRVGLDETDSNSGDVLNIIVCLNSVDTQNADRDRLLRSSVFFDVERFPTIDFTQVRLVSGSNSERYLVGELTLHGVSRPVAFEIINLERKDHDGAGTFMSYAARATIKRTQFGLDAFRMLVSDEVEITIYVNEDEGKQLAGL